MQKCIIGKKIGMTQIFDETGKVVPVTVVEAGPCVVVQKKTVENDGYDAVQMGFGDIAAEKGHQTPERPLCTKRMWLPRSTLREFRLRRLRCPATLAISSRQTPSQYGDRVDVCGTSARVRATPAPSSAATSSRP